MKIDETVLICVGTHKINIKICENKGENRAVMTSLKKGIAIVFGANMLNLVFSLLTNFLLPKYLSVDCYAEIKTFQLYIGYSGILHLGYEDGMYIKYGGRLIDQNNANELRTDLNTLALFQFVLTLVLTLNAVCTRNFTLIACAVAIFPLNIAGCYKLLFQAIGDFGPYAKVSNMTTAITFMANMGLLIFNCFTLYQYYLVAYVAIDFAMMLFCIAIFLRNHGQFVIRAGILFSWGKWIENVKNGMFLMLGNFSSIFLTGMDRWFIKALMDNTAFAMYSFAVSVEGMMNVAVSPISTTLYNYFCCHNDKNELRRIKGKIILFASAIVSCAFPAKFILENFLTKYLDSIDVIFYLFGAQIFYIIVKCFYVNLYKAQKRQKIYFAKLTAVIVAGFLFNAGLYRILHTKEAFAIGTLLCGVLWNVLSELDFKDLQSEWKECLFLTLAIVSYLVLGMAAESLVGFVLYMILLMIYSAVFMREDFVDCIQMVCRMSKKR